MEAKIYKMTESVTSHQTLF